MKIAKTTALGLAAAALAAVSAPERAAAQAEQAWMKDLRIEQLPIARLQPAPAAGEAAAGGAAARELTVNADVDRANALYEQGDTLTLTVATSEDAFVWVFDTGTSGKVHQLFPNRYDDNNFVRGGARRQVPESGAEYELVVSHPPGAELITVVASTENTLPTGDFIDEGVVTVGPFYSMRGDAATLAKDLQISLNRSEAPSAVAHRVVHVR